MFHFLLIISLFFLLCLIKKRTLNVLVLLIGSVFIFVEFISHHTLRTSLNEFAWFYMNSELVLETIHNFKNEVFVFILGILVFVVLMFFIVKYFQIFIGKIKSKSKNNIKLFVNSFLIIGLALSLFFLENNHHVFKNLYDIYDSKHMSSNVKIKDIYAKYGFNSNEIKSRNEIKAKPGKNIVVLLLESTENAFFDEKIYPNLMPYLKSLKDDSSWTFSDKLREVNYGSFGSRYSLLTGMPFSSLFTHNEMLNNVTRVNMLGIGDILKAAGYNLEVILPSQFAKADYLFSIYHFKYLISKEDFNNNGIYNIKDNGWGGYMDKDIFELAKVRYDELANYTKPFIQFVVTINVHFPKGICDDRLPLVNDCMQSAVKNQDMFIKEYIEHISKNPKYKDTIVLIVPDHLSMSAEMAKIHKDSDRTLFYFINRNKDIIKIDTEKYFNYHYFAQKLLDLAEVDSNSKLLSVLNNNENSLTKEEVNIITKEMWGMKR